MISYESSKWYIKILRKRWYFYVPFLFLKINLLQEDTIDMLIYGIGSSDRKKLINSWFEIKKHIELSKMHKYSN